jgi:hypothetical protein
VQHSGGSSAEKGRPHHRARAENGGLVVRPERGGWRGRAGCEIEGWRGRAGCEIRERRARLVARGGEMGGWPAAATSVGGSGTLGAISVGGDGCGQVGGEGHHIGDGA